jgi:hypothetical protein
MPVIYTESQRMQLENKCTLIEYPFHSCFLDHAVTLSQLLRYKMIMNDKVRMGYGRKWLLQPV